MDAEALGSAQSWLRRVFAYLGVLLACAALLCWLYGLPRRDLRIPIEYAGDGLDCQIYGKMIIERGWPLSHESMGAPHGLTLHDFQRSESLQFGVIWGLSLFTSDPFLLINLYYLITFPLAVLVALAVLRHLDVGYLPGVVASLLFAFLPFHHQRGIGHLFLSGYFVVPLGALLALWVATERSLFWAVPAGAKRRLWVTPHGLIALLFCVLLGCAEVYYAFFTCVLVITASLVRSWQNRTWITGIAGAILSIVIVLTVTANLIPQFLFTAHHGPNVEAARRGRVGAQLYDLRVCQMLAPTTGHRIPLIARFKAAYNRHLPTCTENDMASLGLVVGLGFLYLLGRLFVPISEDSLNNRCVNAAARLNGVALLLATMGGFGSMFALAFPNIRAYNRISVFIAFFAIFALAYLLDRLLARLRSLPAGRLAGIGLCLALVVFGTWDETPASTSAVHPDIAAQFQSDQAFVGQVEAVIPTGGMIFQLPYIAYPEGRGYDHCRMPLHARSSRWSSPAMRGRYADLWQRQTCALQTPELLRVICAAGFSGITCDRQVMTAEESIQEAQVRELLGSPRETSPDGRFVFYSLIEYARRLRSGTDPDDESRTLALHPVLLGWGKGFEPPQDSTPNASHWGDAQGQVTLLNGLERTRRVTLELLVRSSPSGPGSLRVVGPGLDTQAQLTSQERTVSLALEVQPGRSTIEFHYDGPARPDRHRWRFEILQWRIVEPAVPAVAHRR